MSLQFFHEQEAYTSRGRLYQYTIAVDVPTSDSLSSAEEMFSKGESESVIVELIIGFSMIKGMKEQFSRKTGRELAKSRLKPTLLELVGFIKKKETTHYQFEGNGVTIVLKVNKGKPKAILMNVNVFDPELFMKG